MVNIKFLATILEPVLEAAEDRDAGTIHLKLGEPPLVRVSGRLERLDGFPSLQYTELAELVSSLTLDLHTPGESEVFKRASLPSGRIIHATLVPSFEYSSILVRPLRPLASLVKLWPAERLIDLLGMLTEWGFPPGFLLVASPAHGGKSTLAAALAVSLCSSYKPLVVFSTQPAFDWSTQEGVYIASSIGEQLPMTPGMVLLDEVADAASANRLSHLLETVPVVVASIRAGNEAVGRVLRNLVAGAEPGISISGIVIHEELVQAAGSQCSASALLEVSMLEPASTETKIGRVVQFPQSALGLPIEQKSGIAFEDEVWLL